MASTKIINVLKDDKFEEVLGLFRNTQAKEVIFILPKTSKAFRNEEYFIILENEAEKLGKKISLLCSSPETNKLAKKYKFDILLANDGDDKPSVIAVNQFNSKKDDEENDKEEEETEKPEIEQKDEEPEDQPMQPVPKFSPAMYQEDNDENDEYEVITVSKTKRGLEDIVKQGGIPLKIYSGKERPTNLEVKKKPTYQTADDIKNVWREQSERVSAPTENIWTGINKRTKKSFRNFPRRSVIVLGGASIILLGTIIYISTGSAKIDITPHKQPLDIQLKVSASDKFSSVDAGLNRIPGQLFNVEKNASQTFPTTGEKEVAQKARGKITVFNEYGTTPQVLIATTRFQTSDGLIFRTLKGITVPGTKVENGKIIPGSISVEAIADKPGQAYNIPASKFGIPAFNERGDIGRYEKIYGRSEETMKGGAIGKAKVVTELDFNAAKQTLSDQVTKDIGDSFKTQTFGLKVINASTIKLKEPESTAKIDEATDGFTMNLSGAIKTVGFKEDDLKNLIKQFIEKTKAPNITAIPEKLSIDYSNIAFDETSDILTFTVGIKGNGYSKIDTDKIKSDLLGKNKREIKTYLEGTASIELAKVVLSPFWVNKIPKNKDKIILQINY